MLFFPTKPAAADVVAGMDEMCVSDTTGSYKDDTPADWTPDFFRPWPLKEGEDLPSKPWERPEQMPMSFVGACSSPPLGHHGCDGLAIQPHVSSNRWQISVVPG